MRETAGDVVAGLSAAQAGVSQPSRVELRPLRAAVVRAQLGAALLLVLAVLLVVAHPPRRWGWREAVVSGGERGSSRRVAVADRW